MPPERCNRRFTSREGIMVLVRLALRERIEIRDILIRWIDGSFFRLGHINIITLYIPPSAPGELFEEITQEINDMPIVDWSTVLVIGGLNGHSKAFGDTTTTDRGKQIGYVAEAEGNLCMQQAHQSHIMHDKNGLMKYTQSLKDLLIMLRWYHAAYSNIAKMRKITGRMSYEKQRATGSSEPSGKTCGRVNQRGSEHRSV